MKKTIPYAIYTGLGLIVYFIIMKIIGLEENFILRIFNFFILAFGVFQLLRNSIVRSNEPVDYLTGLKMGLLLTIISVLIFVVFLGLYIKFFDNNFLNIMRNAGLWAFTQISISQVAVVIFMEGIASGAIITFGWMQYFKGFIPSEDTL